MLLLLGIAVLPVVSVPPRPLEDAGLGAELLVLLPPAFMLPESALTIAVAAVVSEAGGAVVLGGNALA